MGRKWTEEEINLLIRMFPTENKVEMMRILDRSWEALKNKARKLKLKRLVYGKILIRRNWTKEEIERLVRC